MNQGIIVFSHNGSYKAITRITHETIFASAQAGEVIQAAVDAMDEAGGQVFIEQGRYPLAQPIRLRGRVRLSGAGRGTRLEVIGETGAVLQGLDSAEVADLAIVAAKGSEAQAGLILDGCGDCQATNVFAGGFAGHGIWLRNHSFLCTVRGCSAAGNDQSNIFLDTLAEKGRSGEFIPNLVTDCMIYGGGKGIETRRTIVANIVGCCVFQTADTGFHVHSQSNSVVITGCRTFQVGKHAVLLEDTDEFNLSSNIFCWHVADGVVIRNANWGTITGNEIIDTGSYNSNVPDRTAGWDTLPKDLPRYSGLKLLKAQGFSVTGNTIFNWPVCPPMEYGIYEDAASFKNNFTGNNVNLYDKEAVLSLGRESTTCNNIGYADRPHRRFSEEGRGMATFYQTFQTALTDKFVADQVG
ncbi:MAG: hypothetical protein FJ011_04755 [Chloroflexi bacterium]|nr:hypothetical protein [Chloroflexota bacterium]